MLNYHHFRHGNHFLPLKTNIIGRNISLFPTISIQDLIYYYNIFMINCFCSFIFFADVVILTSDTILLQITQVKRRWTTCKIIFPSTSNIGMFIIQSSLLLSPSWQAHSFVLWNSSPLYKGTFPAQCTINFAISPKRYFMNTNYIFDKILTIYSAKFYSLLILDFSRKEDVFGLIWSFFICFFAIQFQMCN